MIAVDTNVIARAFFNDDEKQSPLAQKKIKGSIKKYGGIFISSYSLIELVWLMKVKKKEKKEIVDFLKFLLETKDIFIGKDEIVRKSLVFYEKGSADFSDFMIFFEAQEEQKIDLIATFDKKFSKNLGDHSIFLS